MFLGPLIVGIIVGLSVWFLGQRTAKHRDRKEAIRDLMTYRGDYSSVDFRRALNKVSITFHDDDDIRKQIRELNELINSADSRTSGINRKIVSLIYDLCRRNGFKGITEYDIDQSFPEQKQAPTGDIPLDSGVLGHIDVPLAAASNLDPDERDVSSAADAKGWRD